MRLGMLLNDAWVARSATVDDYKPFVRLFPELEVDDPVPSRERWEQELAPDALVIEAGGEVIAYSIARALDRIGYVSQVVVDPSWRGRGVGRALLEVIARQLSRKGCARWCINVKVGNTPAIRLYENMGFETVYPDTAMELAWSSIERLPSGEASVTARLVDPTEEAALEEAFDLPAGRLLDQRARLDRVLLRLVDSMAPDQVRVGVASFAPAAAILAVFKVARPSLAAPMLAALRPYARAGDASVKLNVAGDPALDAALRAVGARVRFELFHMRGDIPGRETAQ
jgi:GNAT superfamily N-acetyltransferase